MTNSFARINKPTYKDWLAVANDLGLSVRGNELVGGCPSCGGHDRFAVKQDGTFNCRGCEPSSKNPKAYREILKSAGLLSQRVSSDRRKLPKRDPDNVYHYTDEHGKTIFVIKRWNEPDGKVIAPFVMGRAAPGLPPRLKAPGSRPLYQLKLLAENPTANVLIVEGEKTAAVAQAGFKLNCIVTTSSFGSSSVKYTDWAPLAAGNRNIVIWPDADDEGRKYANAIAARLPGAKVVDTTGLPPKWDLGDTPPPDLDINARMRHASVPDILSIPDLDLDLDTTEMGAAIRWANDEAQSIRHLTAGDNDKGKWAKWDGTRYVTTSALVIQQNVNNYVNRLATTVNMMAGDDKGIQGIARSMRKSSFSSGAMNFARAHRVDRLMDYDTDPMTLNTPDGLVRLDTLDVLPHHHDQKLTKISGTGVGESVSELWLQCLDDWTNGDESFKKYLQVMVGYSLFGHNNEHKVMELYGGGGNGKGVFTHIWVKIMGEYAKTISHRVFAKQGIGEEHPTALASLVGTRLAVIPELPVGMRFDEERLKQVSGGDETAARFMRQDYFEFKPICLPLIVGNDQPSTRDVGPSMKRRLMMVPFNAEFKGKEKDPDLQDKLEKDLPGIMKWALDGLVMYQEAKSIDVFIPDVVHQATDQYFKDQDRIGRFIEELMEVGDGYSIVIADMYEEYDKWVRAEGEIPESKKRLSQEMRKRGFDSGRSSDNLRVYVGLRWRPGAEPDGVRAPIGE